MHEKHFERKSDVGGGCTNTSNTIKCSCSKVVGTKSGHTSCARSGNSQDLARTKVDLVFWWRFKLEEVCRWKLVVMFQASGFSMHS
jgi:hypothetical protein